MGACWEIIKCPGQVVCCCCKCACNMLMGCLCTVLVVLVIIGLIVYFTVFYHKDSSNPEQTKKLVEQAPQQFRDFFKSLQ